MTTKTSGIQLVVHGAKLILPLSDRKEDDIGNLEDLYRAKAHFKWGEMRGVLAQCIPC